MAEDLFLPDNLEKLEIDTQRTTRRSCNPASNPFRCSPGVVVDERDLLTSLSLSGEKCITVSCKCNARRRKLQRRNNLFDGHLKLPENFKQNVVRRSRLNFLSTYSTCKRKLRFGNSILREPILKLPKFPPLNPAKFSSSHVKLKPVVDSKTGETTKAFVKPKWEIAGDNAAFSDFKSFSSNEGKRCAELPHTYSTVSFQNLEARMSQVKGDEADVSLLVLTKASRSGAQGQTCSQQALMSTGSACDDITIDELASYFDIFVHIPKKMSRMAEMMYI